MLFYYFPTSPPSSDIFTSEGRQESSESLFYPMRVRGKAEHAANCLRIGEFMSIPFKHSTLLFFSSL